MIDEGAALLNAIIAHPDEDTPRLVYADWLDENRPDKRPSPAAGPSARAEFIRVQCRLAAGAFDDDDYPELLERETDLADWLNTHDPDSPPDLDRLSYLEAFESGEWSNYRSGFLELVGLDDYAYEDEPDDTIDNIVAALKAALPETTARSLRLQDATVEEVIGLTAKPIFAELRGLCLDSLSDGFEDEAVAAIATSRHARGLRRLFFDFPIETAGCRALAKSRHLGNLESLAINYPIDARAVKEFASSRWFRNLRRLHLWPLSGDVLRVLADFPPMPHLMSLSLIETGRASAAAVRRFAASEAFPRLAHLNLSRSEIPADHIELLMRGRWPLRHLDLSGNPVRKAGAEAIAAAPFAETLCVLGLHGCEITAGGVQALAESESLAGLRHLDLRENPIGPGGLAAIAASRHLRGLRAIDLSRTNSYRAPISAPDVRAFLAALRMSDLRHLYMHNLPVAVRGARVLATSPTFAYLTRLRLDFCALGERGSEALFDSKTLANLVALNVSWNRTGAAAAKLTSRKVFPKLADCRLGFGVPRDTFIRLCRRPGIRW